MATWGQRRQWGIIAVVVILLLIAAGTTTAFFLYKPASCTDGKLDQKETGVDCGGPCPYLCTADLIQPNVQFVTAFSPAAARTDVIAYIVNKNPTAGVPHAKYSLELRDANGTVVRALDGTINLPAAATVPLFIPHAYTGTAQVTQAFLTLDPASIVYPQNYQQPVVPTPSAVQILDGSSNTPKVSAQISNPTAHILYGVTVVATVFDAANNAIAASQTLVPMLPAQGTAPLIFTWNDAFRAPPVRVEILLASSS